MASNIRQGHYEQFPCPHGFVSQEHRLYGCNYEQPWITQAWSSGFWSAYQRLVEEATALGAHGVIGIIRSDTGRNAIGAREFTLQGTAVSVPGVDRPQTPFTTFLAGQKLNKLFEAGFVPVSVAASLISVQVYASCITEYQLGGMTTVYGWALPEDDEIYQLSRAHATARALARAQIRSQLDGDVLHAAHLDATEHEVGGIGPAIAVSIYGNRVRRFKDFDQVELPRPVVQLMDR
jgi:hypothetical protein